MDSIRESYYSSDDDVDDFQDGIDNGAFRTLDMSLEVHHEKSSKSNVTTSKSMDFFNLNSGTQDNVTDCGGDDVAGAKTVTVKRGAKTNTVEVPGTEYWSDVQPVIEIKNENPKPTTFSHINKLGVCDGYSKHKRKYYDGDSHDCPKAIMPYQNQQDDNTQPVSSNNKSTKHSLHNTNDVERKLYFVHQKISPHLLERRSTKFKYPRNVFKKFTAHSGVVNRIKWCVPMYSHLLASVSMDGTAKVWNPWSTLDPCVRTISTHSKAVKDIDWSSTGKEILTCSYDRTAAYTDVEKGLTLRVFDHPGFVLCGKHHHGNPSLVVTGTTDQVLLWDVRDAEKPVKIFTYKDAFGQVQDVLLSRDGYQLFASTNVVSRDSADRNIICWDFAHGTVLSNQIYQERYMCTRLNLHPTENNFLVQSHANYIAIFSVNPPFKINRAKRFEGHKLAGNNIGFDISPDGSTVISGSSDGRTYVYHYQNGRLATTLNTGFDVSMDVAIHPVLYSTMAVCGWDGQIAVWQ